MPEIPELPEFLFKPEKTLPAGGTKSSWDPKLATFRTTRDLVVHKIKVLDPLLYILPRSTFQLKKSKKEYYPEYLLNFRNEFGSSCTIHTAILSF